MTDLHTAAAHYEAALKEAFPRGATGDVFHHWNEARKALEQPAQQESEAVRAAWMAGYTEGEREALEQPAQQEPEFFTHCVDKPYDWSEWVCPDPKSYLMKCCDCGLVHEAEFGVVRYESETELEYCDTVDDPNLQAVFRMRRSEQWSPVDMAHRTGGLTMEQPAQQKPVAEVNYKQRDGFRWLNYLGWQRIPDGTMLYTRPAREAEQPAQQEPVATLFGTLPVYDRPQAREPLTYEELEKLVSATPWRQDESMHTYAVRACRALEAAHGITGEKK